MRRIRVITTDDDLVHYDGPFDGTLCGLMQEEDVRYPDVDLNDFTSKRVSCDKCKLIRDFVRGEQPHDKANIHKAVKWMTEHAV